jgi:hypothetical protein
MTAPARAVTNKPRPQSNYLSIAKLVNSLAYRHSTWQVFADFVAMAAYSISNSVDLPNREKREAEYMQIVKRYEPKEVAVFPQLLAELTMAIEDEPSDVMGRVYHELELHNKWAGQYFTPFDICKMMARMTAGDGGEMTAKMEGLDFLTIAEPACGSGAMVIAFALAMKEAGLNYQQQLHVTAVDIDAKCVHMAYLQCSLLHIPATIIRGNTLSAHPFGESPEDLWYTPAHIMGGWDWKLRQKQECQILLDVPAAAPEDGPEDAPATPDFTCDKKGQGLLF